MSEFDPVAMDAPAGGYREARPHRPRIASRGAAEAQPPPTPTNNPQVSGTCWTASTMRPTGLAPGRVRLRRRGPWRTSQHRPPRPPPTSTPCRPTMTPWALRATPLRPLAERRRLRPRRPAPRAWWRSSALLARGRGNGLGSGDGLCAAHSNTLCPLPRLQSGKQHQWRGWTCAGGLCPSQGCAHKHQGGSISHLRGQGVGRGLAAGTWEEDLGWRRTLCTDPLVCLASADPHGGARLGWRGHQRWAGGRNGRVAMLP